MANREGYYVDVDAARKAKRFQENKNLVASLKEGKCCAICESTTDLEFDHVNRDTKKFSLGQACVRSVESILAEVAKCRLLCRSCHWKVTHEQHATREIVVERQTEPLLGILRTCSRCTVEKDLSEFHKDSARRREERGDTSRQAVCKDCEQVRCKILHADKKVWIDSHKKECADCGSTTDLEFDHVRGVKFKGVAMMKSYTKEKITLEIAKCDVVCRPCHMIRTANKVTNGEGRKPGRPRKQT